MTVVEPTKNRSKFHVSGLRITALSLVSLVVVEVVSVLVILALMGCGPMMTFIAKFMG